MWSCFSNSFQVLFLQVGHWWSNLTMWVVKFWNSNIFSVYATLLSIVCSTDYFEFSAKKSFCLLRYLDFSCQMSCHTIRCWLAHIWQKWASIIYTYNKCHTGKMFCLYYCLVFMYYCKHYKRGSFFSTSMYLYPKQAVTESNTSI